MTFNSIPEAQRSAKPRNSDRAEREAKASAELQAKWDHDDFVRGLYGRQEELPRRRR